MLDRKSFAEQIVPLTKTHLDRAIAFLWFYRQVGDLRDRTAAELAIDLHEEDFPKPQPSRLYGQLSSSRFTVRGSRPKSFKIDISRCSELDEKFTSILTPKKPIDRNAVLPFDWVEETRKYLESLTMEINGSYQSGYYDGCAVLMRRIMESLIIETYINNNRADEIKKSGNFVGLEKLVGKICADNSIHISRNSRRDMESIKKLGDTAAHDRAYITHKSDIDNVKQNFRRTIKELLTLAGITT